VRRCDDEWVDGECVCRAFHWPRAREKHKSRRCRRRRLAACRLRRGRRAARLVPLSSPDSPPLEFKFVFTHARDSYLGEREHGLGVFQFGRAKEDKHKRGVCLLSFWRERERVGDTTRSRNPSFSLLPSQKPTESLLFLSIEGLEPQRREKGKHKKHEQNSFSLSLFKCLCAAAAVLISFVASLLPRRKILPVRPSVCFGAGEKRGGGSRVCARDRDDTPRTCR
jgi:hypothetical protein